MARRLSAIGVMAALGVAGPAHAQRLERAHEPHPARPSASLGLSVALGSQAPRNERSPTSVARVAAELVLGVVGAWAGAFLAYNIAEAIADDVTVKGDESYSPAGNVGFVVGSALGSAATVYTIGSIGPARGSPWATLVGAGIPSLVLLVGLDDPYLPLYGAGLVAPLQSLGAATGFNVTRH